MEEEEQVVTCYNCGTVLVEPYAVCVDCFSPTVHLCLICLSQGWQNKHHRNNHRYFIRKLNFPLFDSHWTAEEELLLLDKIKTLGFGNWQDVADEMGRSASECEDHYRKCYLENSHPSLPQFLPQNECEVASNPKHIPYEVSEDPPRPALESQAIIDMAGYMAGRSDFAVEFDNYAELDLWDIKFDDEDDELETEMKLTVLDIYNGKLKERRRRKRIIKKYGLLNMRKMNMLWQQCSRYLGHSTVDRLRTQMRLLPVVTFDKMLESLQYEEELKEKIKQLQEYREAGITTFHAAKIYENIRRRKEENATKGKYLHQVLSMVNDESSSTVWRQSLPIYDPGQTPQNKRTTRKLEIAGLPNYDKLNEKERELCSQCRLVPDAYLEFKNILINEYMRAGSLKLATARGLIKIDVNKTRRIYDHLIEEKLIHRRE